jgi:hypothetical protein
MQKLSIKRKRIIKQSIIYTCMTLSVLLLVTFIFFFVQGYRFNADDGSIEQYAFLQFGSSPSGATVTVDGDVVGSRTPNKTSVHAGKHDIQMSRDGYETWSKTIDVQAGTLTWLNYAILVPSDLKVEAMASYDAIYDSLGSPTGRSMLIQKRGSIPTFELVDINADNIKSTKLTIGADVYSKAGVADVKHVFDIVKWDDGGRYVLIKHTYDKNTEWLVLDTQYVNLTKNITKLFNISISNIAFSGTSGGILYALEGNDVRKLDVAGGTISKPIISGVTEFNLYNSNIITYIGVDSKDANKRVVGIYREGDEARTLRTVSDKSIVLHVATTKYFNDNYVVISENSKVDILSGSYPVSSSIDATMNVFDSFDTSYSIQKLSFSPTGQYVLARNGLNYTSYDLEYQHLTSSVIDGDNAEVSLQWLDNNYLWSDSGGELYIYEFDGTNKHNINSMVVGQDAVLTNNEKYIYSIGKITSGYQLQRVKMVLR